MYILKSHSKVDKVDRQRKNFVLNYYFMDVVDYKVYETYWRPS